MILTLLFITSAMAAESTTSKQPYIDQLREGLEERGVKQVEQGSYTESIKQKLDARPTESYIDVLKKSNPAFFEKKGADSYIEQKKRELEPRDKTSPIEDLKAGRPQQTPRKEGKIHYAAGFTFGATASREISAVSGAGQASFNAVYGDKWAPELRFFYEIQPFHSEWFGNLGFQITGGATYFKGNGTFQFNLFNQKAGTFFGSASQTDFRFYYLPAGIAANYRFNLFRILRPYVQAGPNLIGYTEGRTDGKAGNTGISRGITLSGGVNLELDWLFPKQSWDLYTDFSVKHYYFTIDYSRLTTFSGDVRVTSSGVAGGLTYEF